VWTWWRSWCPAQTCLWCRQNSLSTCCSVSGCFYISILSGTLCQERAFWKHSSIFRIGKVRWGSRYHYIWIITVWLYLVRTWIEETWWNQTMGCSDKPCDSYLGDPQFESWLGEWLSWLIFFMTSSLFPGKNLGSERGHDFFHVNPSQVSVHK